MTKAPAIAAAATTDQSGCSINHTPNGNRPEAMIDPSEIWGLDQTTATKTTSTARTGHGVRYRKAPIKDATALPPWNLRKTGNACPAMTAKAARLIQTGSWAVYRDISHTATKPLAMSSSKVAI